MMSRRRSANRASLVSLVLLVVGLFLPVAMMSDAKHGQVDEALSATILDAECRSDTALSSLAFSHQDYDGALQILLALNPSTETRNLQAVCYLRSGRFHEAISSLRSLVIDPGAEGFVRGAANSARLLGISTLVIGLMVVAFGTSLPEFVVSVLASAGDQSDIAAGMLRGLRLERDQP